MPLIFIHHHKNEVTAFNTECTIGSLNTALADLANNHDSNNASRVNLNSYFASLAARSKASERTSQPPPVEEFSKEKGPPARATCYNYKKVELVPLSFVNEIASNPKLLNALSKRNSVNSFGAMHGGGSSLPAAPVNTADGNTSSASVNNSLTSFLSSFVSNIPFLGLYTAPEKSAYFSLPGSSTSGSTNAGSNDSSSTAQPALVLLGCRMDPLEELGGFSELSDAVLPLIDEKGNVTAVELQEHKLTSKQCLIRDSIASSRLGQQPHLPPSSCHLVDFNFSSATVEPQTPVLSHDSMSKINGNIFDKIIDHACFRNMMNFIKNTHLSLDKDKKGLDHDAAVLVTHPIPSPANETNGDSQQLDGAEPSKPLGGIPDESSSPTPIVSSSNPEASGSAKKKRDSNLTPTSRRESNKNKGELATSTSAAANPSSNNDVPPIPLSLSAQDLLLSCRRPILSPVPMPQSSAMKSSSLLHVASGNSNANEKPQNPGSWLKGIQSLDVLWIGPNGEHEFLSQLLQEFVRVEKQKIAAEEAVRIPSAASRGANALTSGAALESSRTKR